MKNCLYCKGLFQNRVFAINAIINGFIVAIVLTDNDK